MSTLLLRYVFRDLHKGLDEQKAKNLELRSRPVRHHLRLLSGPMVDVYVGEDRRHWCLHRNLLVHHSTYFQDHFSDEIDGKGSPTTTSNLKEEKVKEEPHENGDLFNSNKKSKAPKLKTDSSPRGGVALAKTSLSLPQDDPSAFELLVKWLYQGKIDDVSNMPMERKWDYAESCQKLYILCSRINLPQLRNFAIDQFRKGCNEAGLVPGPEEMKPIYENTSEDSPFRRLISKIAARQIMDPEGEVGAGKYKICFENSPKFAIDVIDEIRRSTGGKLLSDPTEEDPCVYHEHENGQVCGSE